MQPSSEVGDGDGDGRLCGQQHLRLPCATTGPSRSQRWSWSRSRSPRRSPGPATLPVYELGRLMREMCVTQRQLSNDKRIEASAGLHWRPEHAQARALYSELNQMLLPAQLFRARNKLYWLYA